LLTQAPLEGSPKPLWIEIRRTDGRIVARQGIAGPRLFTSEDESLHFRNRDALFKVVPVDGGEAVVESSRCTRPASRSWPLQPPRRRARGGRW